MRKTITTHEEEDRVIPLRLYECLHFPTLVSARSGSKGLSYYSSQLNNTPSAYYLVFRVFVKDHAAIYNISISLYFTPYHIVLSITTGPFISSTVQEINQLPAGSCF